MLNKEQENACFEIAGSVENLYNSQIFNPIIYAMRIWKNYDLLFNAEIFETYDSSNVVEMAQNIIKNEIPQKKEIKNFNVITIALINCKGFEIFPECYNLSINIKKNYYKWIVNNWISAINTKKNESDDEYWEDLNKILYTANIEKTDIYELEEKVNTINTIKKVLFKKEQREESLPTFFNDELLDELKDPSRYYYLNELIAQIFSGGIWNNAVELAMVHEDYEGEESNYVNEEWYYLRNDNINLYIDTMLFLHNDPPLKERIVSIDYGCNNLINYKLCGCHDGKNYCPLGKSEYIAGLTYQLSVKDTIERVYKLIESQEIFEMKRAVAQAFINKFKDMGLMGEYHTLNDLYSNLINIERKIDDSTHIQTRNMQEIKRDMKRLSSLQKLPDFYHNLPPDYQKSYEKIFKDMHRIFIPVNLLNEEDAKSQYTGLISNLGQFIGNILTTIFKPESTPENRDDITIGDMNTRINKKILKEKLGLGDYESCKKFSEKYDEFYNNARHHPGEIAVNFNDIATFIKDSHKLIEIILKYQN